MNKIFFIIGMRRSGTSILRKLLLRHPKVNDIEFEPHPLWNAVDLAHFERFKDYSGVQESIGTFWAKGNGDGWHGAKFALNPGTKAMEWIWLPRTFPEAKFIFITRDHETRWQSYYKEDKNAVRGYIPKHLYFPLSELIEQGFRDFYSKNEKKCCFVQYERLLDNAEEELKEAWKLFGISVINGLNGLMRKSQYG